MQQVVAQIPWGHNIVLLDKVADAKEREWYIKKSTENGWSRNVLVHQIESGLYRRQVLVDKVSNFEGRLPSPQSELAVQTLKDPYVFDFIPFREDMLERDIEQALVRDVTKLLLELGTGFAFLGNQYHLNIGGDDFYIDLLFYNLNLRCYVVIELTTGRTIWVRSVVSFFECFMSNYKHVEFNLTQLEFRNTLNVREIKSSFPTCPKEEGGSFSSAHSELPCCLSPDWPLVLPDY